MNALSVEEIVLMLHGELATAVASVNQYGHVEDFSLDSIRVRMGKESQDAIVLDTDRFPYAEKGWMIDVVYNQVLLRKSDDNINQAKNFSIIQFFESMNVMHLSGVAEHWSKKLALMDIRTVKDLYEFNLLGFDPVDLTLPIAKLRSFQALARLIMVIPVLAMPNYLMGVTLRHFLNAPISPMNLPDTNNVDQEVISQLYSWVQQLELCIDNDYLYPLTFKDLFNP